MKQENRTAAAEVRQKVSDYAVREAECHACAQSSRCVCPHPRAEHRLEMRPHEVCR